MSVSQRAERVLSAWTSGDLIHLEGEIREALSQPQTEIIEALEREQIELLESILESFRWSSARQPESAAFTARMKLLAHLARSGSCGQRAAA